jgi:O-succinylbenzoate synthase
VATETTEELIADAKAWGIEVTVSTGPRTTTGEIVPLPGVRRPTENEREAT